jgi:hypothetical protein
VKTTAKFCFGKGQMAGNENEKPLIKKVEAAQNVAIIATWQV